MTGLIGALQFLTRVPIRTRRPVAHASIVPWFGVAGAIIGAVVGGVAAGMTELVSASVAAAVAVVVGLLITGAFHEDGLADVADAFGGGWTVERRLEILKDSRHGTYGVAALASSVVLRVVCVAAIATPAAMFAGLVAAHTLGRGAAVAAIATTKPASDSGLGADISRSLRPGTTALGLAAAVGITAIATGWWAGPLAVAAIAGTAAVSWLAIRKIGGLAGDVLGAIEQVVECLVLIVVSGLATRHTVWWI